MLITFDNNDPISIQLCKSLLKETHSLEKALSQNTFVSESYKKTIPDRVNKIHQALHTFNKRSIYNISINIYIRNALRSMLIFLEILSVSAFSLSLFFHGGLHRAGHQFSATKAYFNIINSESFNEINYIPHYGEHRYRLHTKYIADDPATFYFTLQSHRALMSVLPFIRGRIPTVHAHHRFCDIEHFAEIIKKALLKATPDSLVSMIVLSITTFLWIAYITLKRNTLLLESMISEARAGYLNTITLEKATKTLSKQKNVNIKNLALLSKAINKNDLTLFISSHEAMKRIFSQKNLHELNGYLEHHKKTRKRATRSLDTILPIISAITIFGAYAFKNTKIGLDAFLIFTCDMLKLVLILITQCI